jgi:hypothetical protein
VRQRLRSGERACPRALSGAPRARLVEKPPACGRILFRVGPRGRVPERPGRACSPRPRRSRAAAPFTPMSSLPPSCSPCPPWLTPNQRPNNQRSGSLGGRAPNAARRAIEAEVQGGKVGRLQRRLRRLKLGAARRAAPTFHSRKVLPHQRRCSVLGTQPADYLFTGIAGFWPNRRL